MTLTPEDVSNKRFTPTRLREGYDQAEVDQFLDEVEAELTRLAEENTELRATPQRAGPAAAEAETAQAAQADAAVVEPVVGTAEPEQIKVTTAAEASTAAARLLEIAMRNADELVSEAKVDAEKVVSTARGEADKLEADSRVRSQRLDTEVAERRQQLLADLDQEKARLSGEVENLRSFEREYRSRLKAYFTQQLASLEGAPEESDLPVGEDNPGPKRLQSLLEDDSSDQD